MLLECAPHHRELYERFKFAMIIEEDRVFYSRTRDLDQMAIAMSRDLLVPAANPRPVDSAGHPETVRPWKVDAYKNSRGNPQPPT